MSVTSTDTYAPCAAPTMAMPIKIEPTSVAIIVATRPTALRRLATTTVVLRRPAQG